MQLNSVFHDWLTARKITNEVIERFSLSVTDHDRLGTALVIPIKGIDGEFFFNKYRRNPLSDLKPKYMYDAGAKLALYGAHEAIAEGVVLLCEGEIDCLVAWSMGVAAVSGTGGAQAIDKEWSSFFLNKEVIVCFDNDFPGGAGMVKALEVIPHAKILFLPDRPGVKDISDYVQSGGNLQDLLKTAKHFKNKESVEADRVDRLALWKSVWFHDAYIEAHKPKPVRTSMSLKERGLERAKEFLCTEILDFRQGKAECPWHREKTPSLHYYADGNRVWCFGCHKGGDVIDLYMQVNKASFKEAVAKLQ